MPIALIWMQMDHGLRTSPVSTFEQTTGPGVGTVNQAKSQRPIPGGTLASATPENRGTMFIQEILAGLHDELALLEQVIISLEKLSPAEMLGSVHPPARSRRPDVTRHWGRHGQGCSMNGARLSPPQD